MPGFAGVIVLMLPPIIDNQTLLSSTLLVKQKQLAVAYALCYIQSVNAVVKESRFSDTPV